MRAVDVIERKVEGKELSGEEIAFLVNGYVSGSIPDYQMSAFMMAVVFKGMTEREVADLTMTMMNSGDIVDLSDVPGFKVDKHSTGGVGDTTTLVIAPLVAACGGTVAKMSGRGLGHTGGTLDKLESIPGLKIEQDMDSFKDIVRRLGVAVIGQSGNLVPADKKMYALRDVTGTVRSIPLIAGSIMSKKLAAGTDGIVLDVKVGSGAFMRTLAEAEELSRTMVEIGKMLDRKVAAVITDMNQPLGLSVGNALEFREAIQVLSGQVALTDPLADVCLLLGSHMLVMSGKAENEEDAREKLIGAIRDRSGLEKLRQMVEAEGGDSSYIDLEKIELLCQVKKKVAVYPEYNGYICGMNAEGIGTAAQMIGAGREKKEDTIDHAVGLIMHKRLGDAVKTSEPICTFYVNDETRLDDAVALLKKSVSISGEQPARTPMVYEVIS